MEKGASRKLTDAYIRLDNAIECWTAEVEHTIKY